jgi:hypothetical protein
VPRLATFHAASAGTLAAWCARAAARAATVVAAASIVAFPTAASVFKCAMEGGGFMYQEAPCAPGKELRNFDTDPPTLSVIPGAAYPPAPSVSPPPADKPAASPDKSAKRTASGHDDRANGRVEGDVAARRFIRAGMSRNARWSYLPAAGDPDTITTITFSGNVVSDVSRKLVKR